MVESSFVLFNAMLSSTYMAFSDPCCPTLPLMKCVCVGAGNDLAIPCSTKFLPTIEDYTDLSEFTLSPQSPHFRQSLDLISVAYLCKLPREVCMEIF